MVIARGRSTIFSRVSLRTRFFAVSSLLLLISLVVVYAVILPQYNSALLEERTTIVSEQLRYATQTAHRELLDGLLIAKRLAAIFATRPAQFEQALKDQIATHSGLIRVSVVSLQTGDVLEAHSSSHSHFTDRIAEPHWQSAKFDSLLSFAFLPIDSATTLFATRLQVELAQQPYLLSCYFNASELVRSLLSLPFGNQSELCLYLEKNEALLPLAASPNFKGLAELRVSSLFESRILERNGERYLLVSSPFQTFPIHLVAIIPESVILQPASHLMWYSLSFVLAVLVIMFVAAWAASSQVTKPVQQLVEAVRPMQSLDFSHKIEPLDLPELRILSQTIDAMRETLDRYQKMNVEKIIFEEWKTKLLMTYSEDMIGIAGSDDRFTFQNARFAELCQRLGFQEPPTREAFFKHPLVHIIKDSQQTERSAGFEAVRHHSEINIALDDLTETYRVQTVALYSQEKHLLGSFIILHDLTQERELEKIKEETLNIVVHELRSPLNSVIGFSDLLLQPSSFDEASKQQFITLIHQSGHKLLKLVNRFLDVMRLESGRQQIFRVPVYLPYVVQMLMDLLRPQAEEKSVSFSFKCEGEIPTILASEELMAEAIQNLMTNAIKYGDPNRTIEMELHATAESVIFSITDYGYGIPPEAQQKLFTKFYRVQSPMHSKEIGTGLGLAYVKEIVSRHGGTITFESNPHIGTRFTITLPIKAPEPVELNAAHQ